MSEENGFGRMDRIERALENLAERMDMMAEHHDREFKAMLRWQVVTQGNIDNLTQDVRGLTAAQKGYDERVDKLVGAIGRLIERLPNPS